MKKYKALQSFILDAEITVYKDDVIELSDIDYHLYARFLTEHKQKEKKDKK